MIKDSNYIRYYIYGYLNLYFCNLNFSYDPSQESYIQFKLKQAFRYLGWRTPYKNLQHFAPFINMGEVICGSIIVIFRLIVVVTKWLFIKRQYFHDRLFIACNTLSSFRVKQILEVIRPNEVSSLEIPFIRGSYHENPVNILCSISFGDILNSFSLSLRTIGIIYEKYRHRDVAFRSYSSFEFYLTCMFVKANDKQNRFIYFDTYNRWAFLMSSLSNSTMIQHGKLTDKLRLIKVNAPYKVYYINRDQQKVVDNVLFVSKPAEVAYRPLLKFTHNELLLDNSKRNVLLVCWGKNILTEWEIVELLGDRVNLYIKPHPGEKDKSEYEKMASTYGCILLPKEAYPEVEIVISYDSTLADEYSDAGVLVIRYDLINKIDDIITIIG